MSGPNQLSMASDAANLLVERERRKWASYVEQRRSEGNPLRCTKPGCRCADGILSYGDALTMALSARRAGRP